MEEFSKYFHEDIVKAFIELFGRDVFYQYMKLSTVELEKAFVETIEPLYRLNVNLEKSIVKNLKIDKYLYRDLVKLHTKYEFILYLSSKLTFSFSNKKIFQKYKNFSKKDLKDHYLHNSNELNYYYNKVEDILMKGEGNLTLELYIKIVEQHQKVELLLHLIIEQQ